METCEDMGEFDKVVETTTKLIAESKNNGSNSDPAEELYNSVSRMYRNKYRRESKKHDRRVDKSLDATRKFSSKIENKMKPYRYASTGAAAIGGSASAIYAVKLKTLKKELRHACNLLKVTEDPSEQRTLESQIDKIQKDIRNTKKKLGIGTGVAVAGLGAKMVVNRKEWDAKRDMYKRINSSLDKSYARVTAAHSDYQKIRDGYRKK